MGELRKEGKKRECYPRHPLKQRSHRRISLNGVGSIKSVLLITSLIKMCTLWQELEAVLTESQSLFTTCEERKILIF